MTAPYPPFPSEADFLSAPDVALRADDIDGTGTALYEWMGAVGDYLDSVPGLITTGAGDVLADHITGVAGPHTASAIVNVPSGSISETNVQTALNGLDSRLTANGSVTAHIADTSAAHAASAIGLTPFTGISSTDLQAGLAEVFTESARDTHVHTLASLTDVDTTGAIANSVLKWSVGLAKFVIGVDNDSGAGTGATQLDELSDVDLTGQANGNGLVRVAGVWTPVDIATQVELDAHISLATAAHAASAVVFTPAGTLAAITVQAAIEETASEALQKSSNLSDLGSATAARGNLGLGSIATQSSAAVTITGGSITGIADLAVADGGTGASTAGQALTNLGAASTSHGHTLASLTDVDVTGISVGQQITWNGTQFTGAAPGGVGTSGRSRRVVTASGTVTVLTTDDILLIDPNGASRTVTLPTLASAITANSVITIIRNTTDADLVLTIDGSGSETVVNDASFDMTAPGESITLVPTTARWLVA